MQVLNPKLYTELVRRFGADKVIVRKNGERPTVCTNSKKYSQLCTTGTREVDIISWGETYAVNCPCCGDTKLRFNMSHAIGMPIKVDGLKKYCRARPFAFTCFNDEVCKLYPYVKDLLKVAYATPYDPKELEILLKDTKKSRNTIPIISGIPVPQHLSLRDLKNNFPTHPILKYLEIDRQFEIGYLEKEFNIGATLIGHKVKINDEKTWKIRNNLIYIPVVNQQTLGLWQLRHIKNVKNKYLNPPNVSKTNFIYNLDEAMYKNKIVIVEGVTDVWRIGKNAISIFGCTMSAQQEYTIKTVWGFESSIVICLDPTEEKRMIEIKQRLAPYITKGIDYLILDKDKDPCDYSSTEINKLINNKFEEIKCNLKSKKKLKVV